MARLPAVAEKPASPGAFGGDCTVTVAAYTRVRNNRPEEVSGYTRSNPHCHDNDNTQGNVVLAQAGGRTEVLQRLLRLLAQRYQNGRPPSPAQRPPSAAGAATPRESLRDILAPGGRPIGRVERGSEQNIRTLDGGDDAARAMFDRLTRDRGAVDVTPPGYDGRLVRLSDKSFIGYRPASRSGPPAVDIRIPGFTDVVKLHFVQ